ncbi:unnamed protein product [Allacma fusca]|uniref:Translation initiation factor eIF-2B subunit beta n=1 Tax=Allacma fusca TaxID=39272 RepID=A0A8J2NIT1_9HEXA|nr:unnamed protein product [Allacma fusca]
MGSVEEDTTTSSLLALEALLKRGQYTRSGQISLLTLDIVEKYVQSNCWKTAGDLITWLQDTAETLRKAAASETASGNLILRLIKIVRDDFTNRHRSRNPGLMSQNSVDSEQGLDFNLEIPELRSDVQNTIYELQSELELSAENIAEEADKHIHSNEVVLTMGKSKTVEAFLKRAAKKAVFEVIVAECAPASNGHELAHSLASSKIQTTLIADTAIFAMMSRVNKVIIGTHSVLANGGLKAIAGIHLVALAAKYYNVPVIVLVPMYKLSPEYPLSTDINKTTNRFVSPDQLLDYSDGDVYSKVCAYNPVFDYVPPNLISLFIFNIGSLAPSYIYRLLHETYPQIKR